MPTDAALYTRAWQHGLTVAQLRKFLEDRGYACEVCGKLWNDEEHGGGLALDHDSSCCPRPKPLSGKSARRTCGKCLRGLLCIACNAGLGQFHHSPDRLRAATAYLERAKPAVPAAARYRPEGFQHHQAKFTEQQVRELRMLASKPGWTTQALARRFRVGDETVRAIVNGERYQDLPVRLPLTPERKAEIVSRYRAGGIRQSDLAAQYGCTQTRISQVLQEAGAAPGKRRDITGRFT